MDVLIKERIEKMKKKIKAFKSDFDLDEIKKEGKKVAAIKEVTDTKDLAIKAYEK